MTHSGYLDHTRPLFKSCKILNVIDTNKLNILIDYKKDNGNLNQVHHHYLTRNRNLPLIPAHSSNLYKRSLSYLGPKLFLEIPQRIRNIANLHKFKRELTKYLLDQYKSYSSLSNSYLDYDIT